MQANNLELFQNAYNEYISSNISIRNVAKKFGINHNTFYLYIKKEHKVENKRNYGGRKKLYSEEALQKAFADIEKGIEISLVASKHNIKKSTLRNYYSLYKTKNEKVKTINKTIKKLKETKQHNTPKQEDNEKDLPKSFEYTRINDNIIEVEYKSMYDSLPEEMSDVTISFYYSNETGLKINLSFLVLIFGKKEPIAGIVYNELSNYRKIENFQQMYQSPYKEWFQQDYFYVNALLEVLRQIKSNLSVIEEIKNIYMFLKNNKSVIEKLFNKTEEK